MSVESLSAIINQLLPEPHAGLLAGIMFGTKATLSKQLIDALIRTGTLHIIALSGMNISIIAGVTEKTLTKIISRRISSLITIVLVILFILFVGPSPSVIRAGIMGSINLFAISLGRQRWALYGWIIAVGGMLVLNHLWLWDLSFQLSALASLGIILFGGKNAQKREVRSGPSERLGVKKLDKEKGNGKLEKDQGVVSHLTSLIWSLIKDDLQVTLAAQSLTIPIILFTFHRLSLISPLSNILIGPTIAPITIIGGVVVILGSIWLPLGQAGAWVAWLFLHYVIWIVTATSSIPFASLGW